MKSLCTIILAAGASTRLGQPKQLLLMGEKTLLAQICGAALTLENQRVIVVLGAYCEAIKPAIEQLQVEVFINENWQTGMGSSIACGMAHLPEGTDAVLLLLCDQPFVTPVFLKNLVGKWRSAPCLIAASAYAGTFGPPAIFDKKLFAELAALQGQQGAKQVMERHRVQMELVDFPEGAADIDTPEDVAVYVEHEVTSFPIADQKD